MRNYIGCLMTLTLWNSALVAGADPSIAKVDATIGQQISGLEKISPQLLRKIQSNPDAMASIVLVDARSADEVNVSVIPGAITKQQYEQNAEKYAGRTIVAYCLSGGRSGSMVRKLKAKGIPAVDLEGSILGWCQVGLPLQTLEGKPTNRVFTYSSDNTVPAAYEAVY